MNGNPMGELNWLRPPEFEGEWISMPHLRFERDVEQGPLLNPPSRPDLMTGNFMFDVTREVLILRPCAKCGEVDPLGLTTILAKEEFGPDRFTQLHGGLSPEVLAAIEKARWERNALLKPPNNPASGVKIENRETDWTLYRCPSCADGGPEVDGPFCVRCGAKKVLKD